MADTLPKTMTENGINYILDEQTGTYLPDWELPEQKPIGKYGLLRRTYLKENKPSLYQAMLLKGTLNEHLSEIDEAANRRLDMILPEMKESAGITEYLKSTDQMKWVGLMNSVMSQAEEIILNELIYI